MPKFSFFGNNQIFPANCVYNIVGDGKIKFKGSADVEHIYVEHGKKNVWLQKRQESTILEYAEYARARTENSD